MLVGKRHLSTVTSCRRIDTLFLLRTTTLTVISWNTNITSAASERIGLFTRTSRVLAAYVSWIKLRASAKRSCSLSIRDQVEKLGTSFTEFAA